MTDTVPTRFQLLWHEFLVFSDVSTPVGPIGLRWPWPAEFTVTYRIHRTGDRCRVHEQGDRWISCETGELLRLLRDRMAGRALEVAEHRGWTPFVGTVRSRAGRRVCAVGTAAGDHGPGWQVESTDGWVSRAGVVLPTPLRGTGCLRIVPSTVDGLECGWATPPLAALLAAAVPRCTARSAVVREVVALLSATPAGAGTVPPGGRVA